MKIVPLSTNVKADDTEGHRWEEEDKGKVRQIS